MDKSVKIALIVGALVLVVAVTAMWIAQGNTASASAPVVPAGGSAITVATPGTPTGATQVKTNTPFAAEHQAAMDQELSGAQPASR